MLVVDDDDDDDMFMCLCIQLFVYISSQNNMILMRSHRRPYSAETMTLKSFIASGKLVKNSSTSNIISSDPTPYPSYKIMILFQNTINLKEL